MVNVRSQTFKVYGIALAVILLLTFAFLAVFLTRSVNDEPGQGEASTEQDVQESMEEENYIGVYNDKIAIFRGIRPDGVLLEITDFDVKEVYREDLEQGIPFEDEEEKMRILESYTS